MENLSAQNNSLNEYATNIFISNFMPNGIGNVDFLKSTGAKPHYFGLGFIQLKINSTLRLHFWHPELTAVVDEEELHDHRYDFKSHILHGKTTHEVFEFLPEEKGDHSLFSVSCKPDEVATPIFKSKGRISPAGSYTMTKGSVYEFPNYQFHRIKATECITLVERKKVTKEFASVVKPNAANHVCPFSLKISEKKLWKLIAELVEDRVPEPNSSYHLKKIPKGKYGEVSKIVEEWHEFSDALKQDNQVMALLELSDQLGAIKGWLENYHPSITLDHLVKMNDATTRAFINGHRT